MEAALSKKQSYDPQLVSKNELQEVRRTLGDSLFECLFAQASTGDQNESNRVLDREFRTFSNLISCFMKDCKRISEDRSSAFKTSALARDFVTPPVLWPEMVSRNRIRYIQDLSWGFPLLLKKDPNSSGILRFTPKSDLDVISKPSLCHYFFVEVISMKSEQDRYRLLVEAIVSTRVGQYLMKDGKPFVLVALYLTKDLIADLSSQIGEDKQVYIIRKKFDLKKRDEAAAFLLEIYNLGEKMIDTEDHMDKEKQKDLTKVHVEAVWMKSFHGSKLTDMSDGTTRTASRAPTTSGLESIPEDGDSETDRVLESDEVRSLLTKKGVKVTLIHSQYAHIADVRHIMGQNETGVIKFVKPGKGKEVEILKYLNKIDSTC